MSALIAGVGAAAPACSDDTGDGGNCPPGTDFCVDDLAVLELDPPDDVIPVNNGGLTAGQTRSVQIRVRNTGNGTLSVKDIRLSYTAPVGATDDQGPPFELLPLGSDFPHVVQPFGGADFPQSLVVEVLYTEQTDGLPRAAQLTFESNDGFKPVQTVTISTESGVPHLVIGEVPVDLGIVRGSDGRRATTLLMLNTGSRDLHVSGFKIAKDGRFGVRGPGFDVSGSEAFAGVDLASAITIVDGESDVTVEVTFETDSPTPANGELIIFSDDPASGQEGLVVPLIANKTGSCIEVNPSLVDFGGKLVGQPATIFVDIHSCGTEPLELQGIAIKPGSSQDFGLDFSTLPEGYTNGVGPGQFLTVPINETVTVGVTFLPDAVNPRDADNVPIPDNGAVVISSNAFQVELEVGLRGAGTNAECPTPVIFVEEGEEVVPQTVLHLDGTQSYAPFGRISNYFWSVPDGLTLVPSPGDPQPVLQIDTVGAYTIRLDVADELGNRSGPNSECPTAEYTVLVQPDQAIHVELTWVTPGDEDETDTGEGVGTDLDLHFAHEYASVQGPDLDGDGEPDPWFDQDWDVFWFHKTLKWGSLSDTVPDDPTLDRDDTDGAGPENLNLALPEDNITYTIGVHYWDDWNFGDVNATVKVFHYADLVYEVSQPNFSLLDMWCVGTIHWPAPVVTRCAADGEPEKITPNYVNFLFPPFHLRNER